MTTISPEGIPNAAPIGIHMKDGKLFARIYASKTLENIKFNKKAVANITDDPVIFVVAALSDIEPDGFYYEDGFPVLKDAGGWIIFDCRWRSRENIVDLSPLTGKINRRKILPVNRGLNAVIEATVHATRYVLLKKQEYLERIEYYNPIVRKCGGPREKEAMRLLHELIQVVPILVP